MKFWAAATGAGMILGVTMGWPEVAAANGIVFTFLVLTGVFRR